MKDSTLIKISIISLILSTIIFIATLLWLLGICKQQRETLRTYENTIIESDYCNKEECFTTQQRFIDYFNYED